MKLFPISNRILKGEVENNGCWSKGEAREAGFDEEQSRLSLNRYTFPFSLSQTGVPTLTHSP